MDLQELLQQPGAKDIIKALAKYLYRLAEEGQNPPQSTPLPQVNTPLVQAETTKEDLQPLSQNELEQLIKGFGSLHPPSPPPAATPSKHKPTPPSKHEPTPVQAMELKQEGLAAAVATIRKRRLFLQGLLRGQKVEYFNHFICSLQPRDNEMYRRVVRCHQIVEDWGELLLQANTTKRLKHGLVRLYEAAYCLEQSMRVFGHKDLEQQAIAKTCKQGAKKLGVPLPKPSGPISPGWLRVLENEAKQGLESLRGDSLKSQAQPAQPAQLTQLTQLTQQKKATAKPHPSPTPQSTPNSKVKRKLKVAKELSPASDSPLKDKRVLIVGGDPKPRDKERIEQYSGAQITWLTTKKHQPLEDMTRMVYNHDVVFLLIRWSSHSYGVLAEHCKKAGVPLVRITHGYNAKQVVQAALSQASHKLGGGHAQSA